jgi:hypothetical protein
MDKVEAAGYTAAQTWHRSKPDGHYADAPHEYHRRSEAADWDAYYALTKVISREGVNKVWRGHTFKYLDLSDGYSCWGWGAVINRVRTDSL